MVVCFTNATQAQQNRKGKMAKTRTGLGVPIEGNLDQERWDSLYSQKQCFPNYAQVWVSQIMRMGFLAVLIPTYGFTFHRIQVDLGNGIEINLGIDEKEPLGLIYILGHKKQVDKDSKAITFNLLFSGGREEFLNRVRPNIPLAQITLEKPKYLS